VRVVVVAKVEARVCLQLVLWDAHHHDQEGHDNQKQRDQQCRNDEVDETLG
jgi:hypothetical protein